MHRKSGPAKSFASAASLRSIYSETLHLNSSKRGGVGAVTSNTRKVEKPRKVELRCVKYSPMVRPAKFTISPENHAYEAKLWRETIKTMGSLRALGLAEVKTFTIIANEPYHCPSNSREFQKSERPMPKITYKVPEENTGRPMLPTKKDSNIPCIDEVHLPREKKKRGSLDLQASLTKENPVPLPLLPVSAVRVQWQDNNNCIDNADAIFDSLSKRFGTIVFTVLEAHRRYIAVFESIKSCHTAVNAGIPPTTLKIKWCDPRFYNFGHYSMFKGYKLSKDSLWRCIIKDLKEIDLLPPSVLGNIKTCKL